jgi:hypothetical protein
MSTHPHRALAVYAAIVAYSAYAGAIALATGAFDTADTIDHRIPFHSPVLAALALTAVVALPFTVVARHAWRGDPRLASAAAFAGAALVAWIAVELDIIREISWLQPLYSMVGVSFIAMGHAISRRPRRIVDQAARRNPNYASAPEFKPELGKSQRVSREHRLGERSVRRPA